MREKKHSKRIRAGNLVRLLSGHYTTDPNAIWFDRWGQRQVGREIYLGKGEIGLVLEIGEQGDPYFGRPQKFCVVLFEERRLRFVGDYWYYFERVKRENE